MNAIDLVLRPLQPRDTSAVADLMSEHALWGDRDRVEHNRRIERLLDRGEYGLIAEFPEDDDRVLVGFALLSDGTFGDHGYIRLFGIRQRLTGRGIGTHLLDAAEALFVHRQMDRAFLLCTDWNTGAQVFYERHGYERVGVLPHWLEPGVDQLIYVKRDLDARSH
jgi:ribosomal protein S18 acetylase RimI-like enzyme